VWIVKFCVFLREVNLSDVPLSGGEGGIRVVLAASAFSDLPDVPLSDLTGAKIDPVFEHPQPCALNAPTPTLPARGSQHDSFGANWK
jgi:hypothetical protein